MVRGYARRKMAGRLVTGRRGVRVYRNKAGQYQSRLRRFKYVSSPKGFLKLYRKLPEMYLTNGSLPGGISIEDPTGTCLGTGTPILETGLGMNTYTVPFSLAFNLKQLINYQDVTNLADAYKIKYVSIRCTYTSTAASVASTAIMPNITWIQDHDDSNPPVSSDEIREKMGSKMKTFGFNKIVKIGVQPRVADSIAGTSLTSTAFAVAKPMWVNSAYPGVEHFGIKGVLSNVNLAALSATSTAFKFDITALVYAKDFQ